MHFHQNLGRSRLDLHFFLGDLRWNDPLEDKQTLRQIPLEFSIDEVRKLLQNLKTGKSPGPDGFHPKFINELADELCLPLYLIFKSSISCAKIPKQWKFARVSAIYR